MFQLPCQLSFAEGCLKMIFQNIYYQILFEFDVLDIFHKKILFKYKNNPEATSYATFNICIVFIFDAKIVFHQNDLI